MAGFRDLLIEQSEQTPDMVEDDERWDQCRLVVVLLGEAVSMETPRFLALFLHVVECVAD